MDQLLWYERLACMANDRVNQAVRTLAQVRKLQRPTLQVNIAEKQVNVVSDGEMKSGSAVQKNVIARPKALEEVAQAVVEVPDFASPVAVVTPVSRKFRDRPFSRRKP
ncbi:MAG: hypothetical protein JNM85_09400 [Chthonomonas sp.]|nr:hypothetical protein [Chthonomonas sp.]